MRSRGGIAHLTDVLVVEDETMDSDRMRATLHLLLGYGVQVRCAATLGSALDQVIERKPELVLLDDVLKPADNALHSIPFLRRAGFDGPIVVISGQVTRQRRIALMSAGAAEVLHKDDVDSVKLAETLQRVFAVVDPGRDAPKDAG